MLKTLVFFVVLISGSFQYTTFSEQIPNKEFARDIVLIVTLLLFSVSNKFRARNFMPIFPLFFFASFFVLQAAFSTSIDYLQHFVRNLFFYPVAISYVCATGRFNSRFIYSTIPILDLLGYIFEQFCLIESLTPDRFTGFFLGPGVAAAVNLLYLIYIGVSYCDRMFFKIGMQTFALSFIVLTQSTIFMLLGFLAFLILNRRILYYCCMLLIFVLTVFHEKIIARYDDVFTAQNTRTISGRLDAYNEIVNLDLYDFVYGVNLHEIIPLDSSYLFVLKYSGVFGLLFFLLYKVYLFRLALFLYRKTNTPESQSLMIFMFLDFFVSFAYNLNFSFILNIYTFSILVCEICHFYNRNLCSNTNIFKISSKDKKFSNC